MNVGGIHSSWFLKQLQSVLHFSQLSIIYELYYKIIKYIITEVLQLQINVTDCILLEEPQLRCSH